MATRWEVLIGSVLEYVSEANWGNWLELAGLSSLLAENAKQDLVYLEFRITWQNAVSIIGNGELPLVISMGVWLEPGRREKMENIKRNVEQERQLVIFSLYGEEFGIEITKVREIVKPREITRLPNVVDFVEGVTNLRGEVIPIIDLKKRFGVEATAITDDSRIIIVDISDNRVGLIVDDVTEVLRISNGDIDPPPRTIAGLKAEYIEGIGKFGDRLLILLDVDRILTTEEKIELQAETLREELVAVTGDE